MPCPACLALSGKPAITREHAALKRDYEQERALAELDKDRAADVPWYFYCVDCGAVFCVDDENDCWELLR